MRYTRPKGTEVKTTRCTCRIFACCVEKMPFQRWSKNASRHADAVRTGWRSSSTFRNSVFPSQLQTFVQQPAHSKTMSSPNQKQAQTASFLVFSLPPRECPCRKTTNHGSGAAGSSPKMGPQITRERSKNPTRDNQASRFFSSLLTL